MSFRSCFLIIVFSVKLRGICLRSNEFLVGWRVYYARVLMNVCLNRTRSYNDEVESVIQSKSNSAVFPTLLWFQFT